MTTGARLVEAARAKLTDKLSRDAPYAHQGSTDAGYDCVGFIAAVAVEAGAVPDVEFEQNYRRQESGEQMVALLERYMDRVDGFENTEPGDVLALCDELRRRPDRPRHLAILTRLEPYPKAIHASERGIREHRVDILFKNRVHSVWRARDMEDG